MAIKSDDGNFQACYWRDEKDIAGEPVLVEFSDFAMELKDRIQKVLREGSFRHAALFGWRDETRDWDLLEEYSRRA